ncbi:LOC100037071, partial, partial [Pelobates cultripes]
MRGIILALLLALAGSENIEIEPVLSESKTSVFSYEAEIKNGIPEIDLPRSGMKLNAKVEISRYAQNTYLMKIRSPEIREFNGLFPKDPFIRSAKLSQVIADQVSKPIKFEYRNGRLGDIHAPDMISELVLNIIRGILNMLQITMKSTQNAYDVQESGIGGVCQTRYVIHANKKGDLMNVVKSTDFNSYLNKVSKSLGVAFVELCPSCREMHRNLRGSATYNYKLKSRGTKVV